MAGCAAPSGLADLYYLTQGVALGWLVCGPLALDGGAWLRAFGAQRRSGIMRAVLKSQGLCLVK